MKLTVSPVLAFLILFVALKLCGIISWSWLWVLSPLWIPIVVGLTVFGMIIVVTALVAGLAVAAGAIADAWKNRDRK